MSRYDALRDHLRGQTLSELQLSFAEIERLVGPLPSSASRPQWWANLRSSNAHAQREAWRQAGYDAFLLAGASKVRFVRVGDGRARQTSTSTSGVAIAEIAVPERAAKPVLLGEALLNGGFELIGRWVLAPSGALALDRPLPRRAGVYVFVVAGAAVYVGIAASGLASRLAFYIRPGSTQRTSQRVGAKLVEALKSHAAIDVYAASPPATSWNGWQVDSASGLEVGLIANYRVPWNLRGV